MHLLHNEKANEKDDKDEFSMIYNLFTTIGRKLKILLKTNLLTTFIKL